MARWEQEAESGEEGVEEVALHPNEENEGHVTEAVAAVLGEEAMLPSAGRASSAGSDGDDSNGKASSAASVATGAEPSVPPPSYDESLAAAANAPAGHRLRVRVCDPSRRDDTRSALGRLGKRYTSYKVVVDTDLPHFRSSSFSVRRRFSDFSLLADRLAISHRGYFVPPRPDKSVLEGSVVNRRGFDHFRASELDRYMKRLASHPHIRESNELCAFLQASGDLPTSKEWLSAAPKSAETQASSASQSMRQLGHSIQHQLANSGIVRVSRRQSRQSQSVADATDLDAVDATESVSIDEDDDIAQLQEESTSPQRVPEPASSSDEHSLHVGDSARSSLVSPERNVSNDTSYQRRRNHASTNNDADSRTYEDRRVHHRQLERLVVEASRRADRLLDRQDRTGKVAGDLGLAAFKLARFEDAEAERRGAYSDTGSAITASASDLRSLYNTGWRVSKQTRSAMSTLVTQLEPLNAFLAEVPAARRAEEDLDHAEVVLEAREDEVAALQRKMERADEQQATTFRGERAALQSQARASAAHERAQGELKMAYEEADTVRQRVMAEYERAEKERLRSFNAMLHGFARAQAADSERAAEAWAAMADNLRTPHGNTTLLQRTSSMDTNSPKSHRGVQSSGEYTTEDGLSTGAVAETDG